MQKILVLLPLLLLAGCASGEKAKNQVSPQFGYNTGAGNFSNTNIQGDSIGRDKIINYGNSKNETSEKVIKGKINLLIDITESSKATTPHLSINEIARIGEENICGAAERANTAAGEGGHSGLSDEFKCKEYQKLLRDLDGRMDTLEKDIFDVLSTVNQTKIEEVPYLKEENEKLEKLKKKVVIIKNEIKTKYDIKEAR